MEEPGVGVGMKSGLDFVIVDSEGQTSDVTDDQSVKFGRCQVDIIVGDSELALHHNRQMTGVRDDYTSGEYNIRDHGCRGSGGDKMLELLRTSDLSNPWRFEEAGS